MKLEDFVGQVPSFDSMLPREQIRLIAWHLHTHCAQEIFDNSAVRACFKRLHIIPPDVSVYLPRMAAAKPPDLLKLNGGYKLARQVRSALDAKFGLHQTVVQVAKLLSDLPSKIPDMAEKAFLLEALKCYRVEAYRACAVMVWNLAFDHLMGWILSELGRLQAFNTSVSQRYPKKTGICVSSKEHFEELKELEVIEVCNTAGLLSKNNVEILREKLKKRNIAAHPSQVVVTRSQADDMVTDLVNNVVLALT